MKNKEIRITTKIFDLQIETAYLLPNRLNQYGEEELKFIFEKITTKHLDYIISQIFIHGITSFKKLKEKKSKI